MIILLQEIDIMNKSSKDDEYQKDDQGHVFHNEDEVVNQSRALIKSLLQENEIDANAKKDIQESFNHLQDSYVNLAENYAKLLEDVKLLTRLSDKLQNKIQQKNDELRHAKHNLEDIVKTRTADLNKAYSDLLNVNTELDSFVYRASHDIRSPLTTFMGLCYLAKMEATEAVSLRYFEMLHQTAVRMDEILSRLLAINKLKNLQVSYEQVEVKTLLMSLIQEIQQKENFRSVKISRNRLEDLFLNTDRNVLEIIFTQMLENAVDSLLHSPQDRHQTEFIHLYVIRQEKHLCVFVKYTGVVIPPAHWEKVFEIFHRTHHGSDITGLRLYTAKLAADKINCQIKITESNQVQTIFELLIPLDSAK